MNYRKFFIRLCTFLGGIYFFLRFVLPERIGGVPSSTDPSGFSGGFVFGKYNQEISEGFILVGAMAVGLGLINLLMGHGSRVLFRRKGWFCSLALLLGLVGMITFTGMDWAENESISAQAGKLDTLKEFALQIKEDQLKDRKDVLPWYRRNIALLNAWREEAKAIPVLIKELRQRAESTADELEKKRFDELASGTETLLAEAEKVAYTIELDQKRQPSFEANKKFAQNLSALSMAERQLLDSLYKQSTKKKLNDLMNNGLFAPLGSAMFALLGFYIAAAAYRAFRIKSAESALMMTAALLVMLGQIPFGMWIWEGFPALRLWLLQVPSTAAARAVEMGAGVAGLVMAFRMWLSIESEKFD